MPLGGLLPYNKAGMKAADTLRKLAGIRGPKKATKSALAGGPVGGGRQMPNYLQMRRGMEQVASARGDRKQKLGRRSHGHGPE